MTGMETTAPLSYDQAMSLAQSDDPVVRKALAERTDIRPEILYFLADDRSPEVRRAAAANATLPKQADLILAKDQDNTVRESLAEKIAKLAPGLAEGEQNKLHQLTYETLETLARDQVIRVRQILSDTLKDVVDAPSELIKTLAMDAELVVSAPVLERSPVLTDDDLLEIIETGPVKGGLGAIARRTQVSEMVSDALAATDDGEAIADLLSNDSAQIREETLDGLIERAPPAELWHAPLVRRPHLPGKAAIRLAQFVADSMIDVLQQRVDLDAETLDAVKSAVQRRIEKSGQGGGDAAESRPDFLKVQPPIAVAERLFKVGKLDNKVIGKALHAWDHGFVLAALAVRGDLSMKLVQEVFLEKSAKGIVAVCWKAGLPAKMIAQVQSRTARIAPTDVLQPKDGAFPMSEKEMTRQINFFRDLAAKGR